MQKEYQEMNLLEVAGHVGKRWWLILLLLLIAAGSSFLVTSFMITPVYEASTTVFIGKESAKIADISLMDIQVGSQLVTDYTELLETNQVLEQVIWELALKTDPSTLRDNLTVSSIKNSRFMRIAYRDPNPELAVKVADRISDILKVKAEDIVGVKNVVIVDYGQMPTVPDSPSLPKNTGIAGIMGIMLALIVIFMQMILDNTMKSESDVETELGLPVLGVIPRFKGAERG